MRITMIYFLILSHFVVLGIIYLLYKMGFFINANIMGQALSNLGVM